MTEIADDQSERAGQERRLSEFLADAEFGRRYYEFVDQFSSEGEHPAPTREEWERALVETGLSFVYHERDDFYRHEETFAKRLFILNISGHRTYKRKVEFIVAFDTPYGFIGGPFHVLAARCEKIRQPGFQRSPLYPRLPFNSIENFGATLAFGMGLLGDVRNFMLAQHYPEGMSAMAEERVRETRPQDENDRYHA
jgi:hypothetical protein